jgi:hypothetical protein
MHPRCGGLERGERGVEVNLDLGIAGDEFGAAGKTPPAPEYWRCGALDRR